MMHLKAVLFDLDGTLLPMNQDKFNKGYMGLLVKKLSPLGYSSKELVAALWSGMAEMVKNDGSESNETVFWRRFTDVLGERVLRDKPVFEEFFRCEFDEAKVFCGYDEKAARAVCDIKSMGLRITLASNPVFPMTAMELRIRWAGLEPEDFEVITAYENIGVCKPNPMYYNEIARRLRLAPEECLMVGNDIEEDMAARNCGMEVFLLTDDLINKKRRNISVYPRGSFPSLCEYIRNRK